MTFNPSIDVQRKPPYILVMDRVTDRLAIRAPVSLIEAVEDWRLKQYDRPSRGEAVRRLIAMGLDAHAASRPGSKDVYLRLRQMEDGLSALTKALASKNP